MHFFGVFKCFFAFSLLLAHYQAVTEVINTRTKNQGSRGVEIPAICIYQKNVVSLQPKFVKNMPVPHSTYFRDRHSERDLCHDFPGDEILIDGLHAMQRHFLNNNVSIDIPVVRVMNTAHYIAAYMFATSCSGDQMEYDALAYDSFCRDRQLMQVTIIVLAAMLQRTEGFRARQCRNVLLQDRSPDFDYGVTLYDRFLRSAEKRFAEEDFLMDTGAQILRLQAENQQLRTENNNLKYTITTMETKYQQINIGTQNNICTQNNYHITYAVTPTNIPHQTAEPKSEPQVELFKYIHPSVTDDNERLQIHREVVNLVRSLSLPDICKYLMDMRDKNKVYLNVRPEAMFAELHRLGMPNEDTPGFSKKNFTSYFGIK